MAGLVPSSCFTQWLIEAFMQDCIPRRTLSVTRHDVSASIDWGRRLPTCCVTRISHDKLISPRLELSDWNLCTAWTLLNRSCLLSPRLRCKRHMFQNENLRCHREVVRDTSSAWVSLPCMSRRCWSLHSPRNVWTNVVWAMMDRPWEANLWFEKNEDQSLGGVVITILTRSVSLLELVEVVASVGRSSCQSSE